MEFVYAAVGVIVIALIYDMLILPKIRFNKLHELFTKLETRGFLLEVLKGRFSDFILESNHIMLYIKVVSIPDNSAVTINSKDTWQLSWGGNKANKGRLYPRKRYLDEVVPFIKEVIKQEKPFKKIVILYPSTEKILRYLNESELEIIDSKKTPHGYKVVNFTDFESDFNDLIA